MHIPAWSIVTRATGVCVTACAYAIARRAHMASREARSAVADLLYAA